MSRLRTVGGTGRGPTSRYPGTECQRLLAETPAEVAASSTTGSSMVWWTWTSSRRVVSSARSVYRPIQNSASATRLSTAGAPAAVAGPAPAPALDRAAAVPVRYVSGRLLGEPGGSHAWVEVLVPDGQDGHRARAFGLDPTNGCRVGPRHLPVAVGRDYTDVAPTSGVYSGAARGQLTCVKHVVVA